MTKQVPKSQNPQYQAQAILSRRDHSEREVRVKLKRKGFTEELINEAIMLLKKQKLLDDARFAKTYVDSILRSKFVGPRYLRAKLKQKGVGESIIRDVLAETFSPPYEGGVPAEGGGRGREAELVEQAAAQWKKSHLKHAHDKQRLYRFLLSRGFTNSAINAMIIISNS